MQTITRRKLLKFSGISAAATALPSLAFSQAPTFPQGAVIRTLLRDYAPEELAGGSTLFHEHLSLAADFMDKFRAASAAVRALNESTAAIPAPAAPAPNNTAAPRPPATGPASGPTTDLAAMVADVNKARMTFELLLLSHKDWGDTPPLHRGNGAVSTAITALRSMMPTDTSMPRDNRRRQIRRKLHEAARQIAGAADFLAYTNIPHLHVKMEEKAKALEYIAQQVGD